MRLKEETEKALYVRLAAGAGTAPEILRTLAGEDAVTVRAAVAMNPAAPADVNRMLARDGDERVRALLARKLAGLVDMPATYEAVAAHENLAAHETLAVLAGDAAVRVRAAIADVVKQMPEAPRTLILRLARDTALVVSDPVIRQSPILTPNDLLSLLASPPAAATAVSVAHRPDLTEAISDAIAATADSGAIRALLTNRSAAIREATLDALIAHAPCHTDWHSPLVNRPTLPTRAARALSEIVAAELLDTLARRADLEPGLAMDLRQRLAPPREAVSAPAGLTAAQALDEAYALRADGRLTEDAISEAVRRGEAQCAAAMLAVAADVALSVVDRAVSLRSAKGLISLVWEAGFSMRVAGPLQAMLTHLAPSAILPPGPGGAFPLATEEMRWQLDFLKRMGR
jgi:uncharacterized protein (DUF2336 family)